MYLQENLNNHIIDVIRGRLDDIIIDCAIKREMILTSRHTRGIGKTTALINFGKKYNIPVIVNTKNLADEYRKRLNYQHIYSIGNIKDLYDFNNMFGNTHKYCVTDELVNIGNKGNFEVITGFIYQE